MIDAHLASNTSICTYHQHPATYSQSCSFVDTIVSDDPRCSFVVLVITIPT